MSILNWFTGFFKSTPDEYLVNPANGLPMTDGVGSLDISGNPFGTDLTHDLLASSEIEDIGDINQMDDDFGSMDIDDDIFDDSFSSAGGLDDW